MEQLKAFLKRKNIVISAKRYGIDALGAMAQGLFCSLLIGTIINTLGEQLGIPFLVDVGSYASAMSGAAMAVAIGYALQAPPLVLFSLVTVGYAANALGSTSLIPDQAGAGGPLAVLFIAVIAAEFGKAVSKETKIDILVTPLVTILVGVGLSAWWAPAIGTAATAVGNIIMWATDLQPFLMGIVVSVVIGVALTLPISSAAICAAFGLTGLAGGAAVAGCCANMVGFAVLSFRENRWGGLVSQGAGHLHAPDAQHRPQPQDLAPCHPHLRHHRAPGHLRVPPGDERSAGVPPAWAPAALWGRSACGPGGWPPASGPSPTAPWPSPRRYGLGGADSHLLRPPRHPLLGLRPLLPPHRLDQRGRPHPGVI